MKNNAIILCFDLDYTLIDNTEGIRNSFNYALKKYNLPEIDFDIVRKMIGMPLEKIFNTLSPSNTPKLVLAFREYYSSKGISQVKLFPGIEKKLAELKKSNFVLGVITSKKEELAVKLLINLKIAHYFDFIFGETDTRKTKTSPELIAQLQQKYLNGKFVVIGDHPNDRFLSELLECPFIGVLTGNHSKEELKLGAKTRTLILNDVSEITAHKIVSLF